MCVEMGRSIATKYRRSFFDDDERNKSEDYGRKERWNDRKRLGIETLGKFLRIYLSKNFYNNFSIFEHVTCKFPL